MTKVREVRNLIDYYDGGDVDDGLRRWTVVMMRREMDSTKWIWWMAAWMMMIVMMGESWIGFLILRMPKEYQDSGYLKLKVVYDYDVNHMPEYESWYSVCNMDIIHDTAGCVYIFIMEISSFHLSCLHWIMVT